MNADYYLTHGVHPSLWTGIRGAWLPSLGNTGFKIPDQVGNGVGHVEGVTGTLNAHYWATNSSSRGGLQIVAQSYGGSSYFSAPFAISQLRQASISCWIGARYTLTNNTTAASISNRYLIAWWNGSSQTAFGIVHDHASGAMWIDGAWRGSSTVWSQTLTHYCFTWGPGRLITVYQNGSVIHSHTMAGATPASASAVSHIHLGYGVGGIATGAQWDDLRTYNRALSPQEVRTLAQRPGVAYELSPRRAGYGSAAPPTVAPLIARKTFSRLVR